MKIINQITLTGILGFIGESRAIKNGAMCNFYLGFGDGKDKDQKPKYGNVECVTFNQETVDNVTNLGKGAKVLVTGRLTEAVYKDKEGKEVHKIKLIVENVCQ